MRRITLLAAMYCGITAFQCLAAEEPQTTPADELAKLKETTAKLQETYQAVSAESERLSKAAIEAYRLLVAARTRVDLSLDERKLGKIDDDVLRQRVTAYMEAEHAYSDILDKWLKNENSAIALQLNIRAGELTQFAFHRAEMRKVVLSTRESLKSALADRDDKLVRVVSLTGDVQARGQSIEQALAILVKALAHPDPNVQRLALEIVVPLASSANTALPIIETLADSTKDASVRRAAKSAIDAIRAAETKEREPQKQ